MWQLACRLLPRIWLDMAMSFWMPQSRPRTQAKGKKE